jgi:hypothetical protein
MQAIGKTKTETVGTALRDARAGGIEVVVVVVSWMGWGG